MAMRPRAESLEALLAERLRRFDARTTEVERHSGETKASLLPRTVQAEQRIEAQQAEISAQAGHITSLGARSSAAEGMIGGLQTRAASAEARLVSAEAELGAQAGHITALGADLTAAQGLLTQLRQQVGTRPQGLTDPLWQELAKLIARVRALETNSPDPN